MLIAQRHPPDVRRTKKKELTMWTRIAAAAALVAASSAIALASEFDPNPANRYPAYAAPAAATQVQNVLRTAPVSLNSGHVATTGQPYEIDRRARGSSPYAGGVG
jgi:hypothetical protein